MAYIYLAGTLMYIGNGMLPQAALVTPIMKQKLGNLSLSHLKSANGMIKDLTYLKPEVR